ncbi:hypothetical protein [Natronosalvus vescus]|uniref:hypothetical protein n=1 Tax=Natronosalvus vescus TaxID=2953881 RepID=UPI0020909431|nr:hypothetical protein [Natronosalvus vescus]
MDTFDLETFLLESTIVEECPDEDDLCLDPDFRTAWRGEIAAIQRAGDRLERLAARLEVEASALALEESSGRYTASYESERIGLWPSEAAFLADLGIVPVLDAYCSGWERLEDDQQGAVVAGLRVFLEACPECDGAITAREEVRDTCCTEITQARLECAECHAVLVTSSTNRCWQPPEPRLVVHSDTIPAVRTAFEPVWEANVHDCNCLSVG